MTEHAEALEDAWYTWEEIDAEQSWLLSYVDVLCVILAMVLVLLVGRLDSESVSSPDPGTATPSLPPVPVTTAAGSEPPMHLHHEPLTASLPPPPPSPVLLDRSTEGVQIFHDAQGMTLQIAEIVLFESSRARLKESARPVLERAVSMLSESGEVDVAIQGHTDDRPVQGGPFRSNWELGAARANAVAEHLLASGLPPERLRLESYADTRPIADNSTAEGRARNRRVELRVELTKMESTPPVTAPHHSGG